MKKNLRLIKSLIDENFSTTKKRRFTVYIFTIYIYILIYLHHLGHEDDDYRLMITSDSVSHSGSVELNTPGLYPSTCVEITLDGLAVTAVLQANHINDYEGGSGTSTSFDYAPQVYMYNHPLTTPGL